jgi:hypothetical protein
LESWDDSKNFCAVKAGDFRHVSRIIGKAERYAASMVESACHQCEDRTRTQEMEATNPDLCKWKGREYSFASARVGKQKRTELV